MIKFINTILLFVLITSCFAGELKGTIIKVIDGDTVYLQQNCQQYAGKYKIRLSDIDAPQYSSKCIQPYGKESKEILSSFVLDKNVIVKFKQIDVYGRIVGTIFIQKTEKDKKILVNINHLMLSTGSAWFYEKYSKDKTAKYLYEQAKKNKLGLWKFQDSINPQIYRKKHKK